MRFNHWSTKINMVIEKLLISNVIRTLNLTRYANVDYWRIFYVMWLRAECYQCPLQWRHNGRDGVSNHRRLDGLLNPLFRRRSKKTSKLFVREIHRWPVNSPRERPVTRKCFHLMTSSWSLLASLLQAASCISGISFLYVYLRRWAIYEIMKFNHPSMP